MVSGRFTSAGGPRTEVGREAARRAARPTTVADRRASWAAVLSLLLLPVLVKSPQLLGLLDADPMHRWAYVSPATARPFLWGTPTADPNIAYTSQALGTLAARLWREGMVPWWNPYEGVGAPLAGEMQSAALFPPTLLLLLPKGQLIEHLLFQIVSGLATYALLRRLGMGRAGAWLGGVAFAFNGAFAWLANAAVNPVCFLPVTVLGVEMLADPFPRVRRWGGALVALGLAGSLYAGFPEVAYLNGVLIGAWTLVRASSLTRADALRFLGSAAVFGLCGLLIAAPVLVSFADYMQIADVGTHGGEAMSGGFIEPRFGILMLLPYLSGTFLRHPFSFWGATGGYAGLVLAVLTIAGSLGRGWKRLRLLLIGWIIVSLGATFGIPPFLTLMHLLPMTRLAALYRYLDSSWLFAMSVLAGFAVDDLASEGGNGRKIAAGLGWVALMVAGLGVLGWVHDVRLNGGVTAAICALQVLFLAGIVVVVWVPPRFGAKWRTELVAVAAAAEMIALFALPTLSHPRSTPVELGGVRFLQQHQGLQRFVTLGPLTPNYGSFFGIAEVNHNDLPVPRDWVGYARRHLEPDVDPILLSPSSRAALMRHLPGYAAIGTRYVVARNGQALPGLPLRYADGVMRIHEIPGVRPYFTAPSCVVAPGGRTDVDLACSRPSRLERLELLMPGWSATVNGRDAPLLRTGEIFQAVDVPAGRARVTFRFRPPHLPLALILFGIGILLLIVQIWVSGERVRSRARRRSGVAAGGGDVYALEPNRKGAPT